jgi:formate-dependent nitrite reductase membrane component NrfD
MRSLFLVGAKLLGIYLIVDGLIEGLMLMSGNAAVAPYAVQIASSSTVRLMAGTALVFFTGIVAIVVRIPQPNAEQVPVLTYQTGLEVGIVLLGLYQLVVALPSALMRMIDFSQQISRTRDPYDIVSIEVLRVALAVAMIGSAHRIAVFLERVNRHSSGP